MAHWNHRLIRRTEGQREWFALHEVFYDDTGAIDAWTEDAVDIIGDSREDVLDWLKQMIEDIERLPVLEGSDLDALLQQWKAAGKDKPSAWYSP